MSKNQLRKSFRSTDQITSPVPERLCEKSKLREQDSWGNCGRILHLFYSSPSFSRNVGKCWHALFFLPIQSLCKPSHHPHIDTKIIFHITLLPCCLEGQLLSITYVVLNECSLIRKKRVSLKVSPQWSIQPANG